MIATNEPAERAERSAVPDETEASASSGTIRGVSPTSGQAAHAIARLFPEVYRRFHSAAQLHHGADLPVTRRSLGVLRHLAASGPLTVGEQAEHLGLRRNSVSELLQRLEHRGLVARIRDERDERRVLVWLTDAGRDVVARVGEVLAPDRLQAALDRLSPDERAIVVRGFELLARAEERDPVTPSRSEPADAAPPIPRSAPTSAHATHSRNSAHATRSTRRDEP